MTAPIPTSAELAEFKGFFSAVWVQPSRLLAVVDRTRSIPLFYARAERSLYLSDDPLWIRARLGRGILDSTCALEFLLTGYVTGPETLDPRIRQLQAGEALSAEHDGRSLTLSADRYFRIAHAPSWENSEEELLRMLDQATVACIERLIQEFKGHQLVIPLSGGLDSRLIAMTLRRLDRADIVTFTYGVPGNPDAEISRRVARKLGFHWEFVEYSQQKWLEWSRNDQLAEYRRSAEALVSLAHLQDWPAVMELKHRGVIDDGAVFVPGHTSVHPLAANRLPRAGSASDGGSSPADWVWALHYCLMTVPIAASLLGMSGYPIRELMMHRVDHSLSEHEDQDQREPEDAYQEWKWREREAKFIGNSVRVYEAFGCGWWMPWCDTEFVEFWRRVPWPHWNEKALLARYVREVGSTFGMSLDINMAQRRRQERNRLRAAVTKRIPPVVKARLNKLANRASAERQFDDDHLARGGRQWIRGLSPVLGFEAGLNGYAAADQILLHLREDSLEPSTLVDRSVNAEFPLRTEAKTA